MITREKRLEQLKYVVDSSEHVKINYDKISEYIKLLDLSHSSYWFHKDWLDLSEEEYIRMMFLIESMNFCFWKEPYFEKEFFGKQYKKSTAMFFSMIDKIRKDANFLEMGHLLQVTKEELLDIFGGNKNLPFLEERYQNFMETVTILNQKKKLFYQELYSITSDEELLDYIVSNFPSFNDVSQYKGETIYFYKRATLLVRDLFEVSSKIHSNIGMIDRLLGCADYGIPRTFRHFGILEYSDVLSEMVDSRELIPHDSNYEIEIRANMLYALEFIREFLQKSGRKINSIELDNIIWSTGRNIEEEHHLTKTIFY